MIFKDLFNYVTNKNVSLINAIDKDYLTDYYNNSDMYDIYFLTMYKSLILNDTIENCITDDNITLYNNIIKSVILINDYKYNKLYQTTLLEYNPIWNVDGKTITTYGSYTVDNLIGENEVTNTYGEHSDNYVVGAKTDTSINDYGERINVNGERITTDTQSLQAYDSTDYVNTNKNVSNQSEVTDTQSAYQDKLTNTTSQSTNTTNFGKVENKINNGSRADKETYSEHKDTIEKQGNIGVTSTQNLINQEREVAMFSFYNVLFNDIIDFITIGVYESEV